MLQGMRGKRWREVRRKIRYVCERGEACNDNHSVRPHTPSIRQFQVKVFPVTREQFHIGLVNVRRGLLFGTTQYI